MDEALIDPPRTAVAELNMIIAVAPGCVIEQRYGLARRGVGNNSGMTVSLFADRDVSLDDRLLRARRRQGQEGSNQGQCGGQKALSTPSLSHFTNLLLKRSGCCR